MSISSGSLGGSTGGSGSASSPVYWSGQNIPDSLSTYTDYALTTAANWSDVDSGAMIVSKVDNQVWIKQANGTVAKSQTQSIIATVGDGPAVDVARLVYIGRGLIGGVYMPVASPIAGGIMTSVLEAGPMIGVAQVDANTPTGTNIEVVLQSPLIEINVGGAGTVGEPVFLKMDGTLTATRPSSESYYEIGIIISGPSVSTGRAMVIFSPRFRPGAASVSGSVLDNSIVDSRLITTPGRYIVPKEDLVAVPPVDLLNEFDGQSNKYADWTGSVDANGYPTGFVFTAPANGDTVIITTGTRTGEVWRYKASTTSWSKVTQTTGLPIYSFDQTVARNAGDMVIYNQALYQANAAIPAGTPFAIGSTGATWKQIGLNGLSENGQQLAPNGSTALSAAAGVWQAMYTFTVPSAGTWDITGISLAVVTSGMLVKAGIRRADGTVDATSVVHLIGAAEGALVSRCTITTTAAETLTLVMSRSTTGAASLSSNVDANRGQSKVMWNKIAGYQPVAGQAVDYLQVRRAGATLNLAASTDIVFNTVVSGNIGYATGTGVISLTAGKTYRFSATISMLSYSTINSWLTYALVDAATNTQISPSFILLPMNYAAAESMGSLDFIYTPVTNQTVKLRVIGASGTGVMRDDMASMLLVQQIGSTALATTTAPSYQVVATSNVTYTLPASYSLDTCRFNAVTASECLGGAQAWFNTSTYRFTPQVAGWWDIAAAYDIYRGSAVETGLQISKNGTRAGFITGLSIIVGQTRRLVYLNGSTDYVDVQNLGNGALSRIQYATSSIFQARWLGA